MEFKEIKKNIESKKKEIVNKKIKFNQIFNIPKSNNKKKYNKKYK